MENLEKQTKQLSIHKQIDNILLDNLPSKVKEPKYSSMVLNLGYSITNRYLPILKSLGITYGVKFLWFRLDGENKKSTWTLKVIGLEPNLFILSIVIPKIIKALHIKTKEINGNQILNSYSRAIAINNEHRSIYNVVKKYEKLGFKEPYIKDIESFIMANIRFTPKINNNYKEPFPNYAQHLYKRPIHNGLIN